RADEAPRVHPLRRAGRRLGRADRRPDGSAGARGIARDPHEPARGDPRGGRSGRPGGYAGTRWTHGGGTTRIRAAGRVLQARVLLLLHGLTPTDAYRIGRFARL